MAALTATSLATVYSILEQTAQSTGNQDLLVGVNESTKGALKAGIATLVGGLLLGPLGLAIGGAVGGIIAYATATDFQPAVKILHDMNAKERELLARKAMEVSQAMGVNLLQDQIIDSVKRKILEGTLKSLKFDIKN